MATLDQLLSVIILVVTQIYYIKGQNYNGFECGIVPEKPNKTVPLDYWDWPWLVAIGRGSEPFEFEASGALISSRYVLTSLYRINLRENEANPITHVRVGEYDFRSRYDDSAPEDYSIVNVYKHEDKLKNDIAVLELDRDVEFNDYVRPVCLPDGFTAEQLHKKKLPVVTYGHYNTALKATSSIPFEKTATVLKRDTCYRTYSSTTANEHTFCAGVTRLNSCFGEIGGPVNYKNPQTGKWMVVGLLTLGDGCATDSDIGGLNLVINVMNLLPFIHNVTNNELQPN